MNNYERIRNMSIDDLAEFLDERWSHDNDPSIEWWNRKYCGHCEPVMKHVNFSGRETEMDFAWCEVNGKCKYFPELEEYPNTKQMMKLWLEEEIESDDWDDGLCTCSCTYF